jgi:hypothetical protein
MEDMASLAEKNQWEQGDTEARHTRRAPPLHLFFFSFFPDKGKTFFAPANF